MGQSYLPLEVIPAGPYCYDENGLCPYWSANPNKHEQERGYCSLLRRGDWQVEGLSLLWDQCKECNHNWDDEDAGNGRREADYVWLHSWQFSMWQGFVQRTKLYKYGIKGEERTLLVETMV